MPGRKALRLGLNIKLSANRTGALICRRQVGLPLPGQFRHRLLFHTRGLPGDRSILPGGLCRRQRGSAHPLSLGQGFFGCSSRRDINIDFAADRILFAIGAILIGK